MSLYAALARTGSLPRIFTRFLRPVARLMRVSLTEKREFWGDQVYVSYSHILTSLSVNFGVFHHFVILVLHIVFFLRSSSKIKNPVQFNYSTDYSND